MQAGHHPLFVQLHDLGMNLKNRIKTKQFPFHVLSRTSLYLPLICSSRIPIEIGLKPWTIKIAVLDRQVLDRGGPSHVQAFLNDVLFPSARLLIVHPQQRRSRTLTVAVTHPGTNAHNCSLK